MTKRRAELPDKDTISDYKTARNTPFAIMNVVKNMVRSGGRTMPKRSDNIHKRKDGRWEGRYRIANNRAEVIDEEECGDAWPFVIR